MRLHVRSLHPWAVLRVLRGTLLAWMTLSRKERRGLPHVWNSSVFVKSENEESEHSKSEFVGIDNDSLLLILIA